MLSAELGERPGAVTGAVRCAGPVAPLPRPRAPSPMSVGELVSQSWHGLGLHYCFITARSASLPLATPSTVDSDSPLPSAIHPDRAPSAGIHHAAPDARFGACGGAASWPWTNHRVGGVRLKGCRLVRHDGSTARANPTVNLALPAPHAPTPSTPNMLHGPLGMPSTDPCRPSASRPSPPADGICLLDLSAGLIHRRSPAGGRSGARRGARASSSSTRAVGRAAQGGHQFSRLASL